MAASEGALKIVKSPPKPMSVGELNRTVKAMVEEAVPSVWVEGEITALKSAGSGHVYFDLKDDAEDARVSCVLFKRDAAKSRATLANGERVQLKGRPGLFVPRGQFQFIAEMAVPAGAGAAAAALAALKEKLAAEGLFAQERKRKLPRFPRGIGVVTSATGAAFQDICREAHRRWPARIVLCSSLVQGADAPQQIARAINWLQRVKGVDVLIVGRGGGASEDLAAFNEERVARAIGMCRIPVISAVGHEVDFTVADLVADVRAATPTMAATLCLPEMDEERERLRGYLKRLQNAMELKHSTLSRVLLRRAPPDPRRRVDETRQRIDDLARRAAETLRGDIRAKRALLDRAERALALAHPKARVARDKATLDALTARLAPAMERLLERSRATLTEHTAALQTSERRLLDARTQRFAMLVARLDALSPVAILARGYSVVLREGKALVRAAEAREGDALTVRLHEGTLDVRVASVNK